MSADDQSDDQTLRAPDEVATGIVASDDTMAAPDESAADETAVIAPADAVTHLDQLAWSDEAASDDPVPYPATGAIEVDAGESSWGPAVAFFAATVAALAVVVWCGFRPHEAHDAQAMATTTAAPTHQPLGCPAATTPDSSDDCKLVDPAPTIPPSTPVTSREAPPVTITSTVTQPPAAAVIPPTPTTWAGVGPPTLGVAAFQRGIGEAPPFETMPANPPAVGREVCSRMASGQARMDIENTISDEYGIDFASAAWVFVQASRKLC